MLKKLFLLALLALPAEAQVFVSGGGGGSITPGSTLFSTCTVNSIFYNDASNVFQCNGFTSVGSAGTWTFATPAGNNIALLATAPAATTGASQAGKTAALTASAAVASTDTAGAAAGGNVTLTGGAAARFTSGNANGGDVVLVGGSGIGTGTTGKADLSGTNGVLLPDGAVGTPSLRFNGGTTTGFYFSSGVNVSVGGVASGLFAAGGITLPSASFYGWNLAGTDTFITRGGAAATIQFGNANAASPVAQIVTFQGSRGGTDTDVAGTASVIQSSLGTGAGAGSSVGFNRAIMKASGTTQQTAAPAFWACESKTLSNTSATATAVVNITLPNNSSGAGYAQISVQCNDGTNFDSDLVTSYVSYVNKAGTLTFGTPVTTASSAANNSGSCTVAPTWVANGTTSVDLKVTPVITTITPTTTTVAVNFSNFGGINAGGGGVVSCK